MLILGVITAYHLPPSHPLSILLGHTNPLHILFHCIPEPPLQSSSFPPAGQLHIQHQLFSILIIPPLHISKPSQSELSF